MRLIVITDTAFRPDEAEVIRILLGGGIDRVHVRKPSAAEGDLRRLLEALPAELYPQLTLHDALPLAVDGELYSWTLYEVLPGEAGSISLSEYYN